MNCAEFQERLFEWLEGRLEAAEIERMRAHVAGCLRCRELEELATGDAGLPAVEPPDDLVASILANTTGGACDRALLLVSERLDAEVEGSMAAADPAAASALEPDPLLEMHLDSCAECARLAAALERLQRELPAMAEMEPDAGFVADVLAATVGAARPSWALASARDLRGVSRPAFDRRSWLASLPWVALVSDFWERLAQRPRLAFEGAFVSTLAFVLIIGLPSAGIAELPSRLMAEVRQEGLEVHSSVAENLGRAVEAGRAAYATSRDRLGTYVDMGSGVSSTGSRFAETFERWRQAGVEIAAHLWQGELGAAFARLWRLWTGPGRAAGIEQGSPGRRGGIQEG